MNTHDPKREGLQYVPKPNTRERWDSCPVQLALRDSEGKIVGGPYPVRPCYAQDFDAWLDENPVWVIERVKK